MMLNRKAQNRNSRFLRRATLLCFLSLSFLAAGAQHAEDSTAGPEEYRSDTDYNREGVSPFLEKKEEDSFSVTERHLSPEQVAKMKKDKDFWYADKSFQRQQQGKKEADNYVPLGQRGWFRTLLWMIILCGFAGMIIWYLSGSNMGLLRRKNRQSEVPEEGGLISDDIFSISYNPEIDKAAAAGNYRLAIRLLFLRLLKNLSDKNMIDYKQDRTNFDYLVQLQPSPFYDRFFRLTRHYEYSWYGQFEVKPGTYSVIRNEFDQFDREI